MENEYKKLREDLFNLRIKKEFQKKQNNQREYLETENEILSTKENIKNLLRDNKEKEIIEGGRKK